MGMIVGKSEPESVRWKFGLQLEESTKGFNEPREKPNRPQIGVETKHIFVDLLFFYISILILIKKI